MNLLYNETRSGCNYSFVFVIILMLVLSITLIPIPDIWAVEYLSQFGSLGSGNGQFSQLYGIAIDSSGNIYVVDTGNHRVQKFNSAGVYLLKFGSSGSGNGQFNSPRGIAVDSSGNIYVADTNNDRVQKFTSTGVYRSQYGSSGSGDGQFSTPNGVAVDSSDNIYVADTGNSRVQKFNSGGLFQSKFGSSGTGNGQFIYPNGIAVDSSGNIYVADTVNHRVQKFNSAGVFQSKFGSSGSGNGQFSTPNGVAVDSSGNIYVADTNNHRVQIFNSAGVYLSQFGSSGSGNGQFSSPRGIAFDSSGNIYVADTNNNRVQKFNSPPTFSSSTLNEGTGVFAITFSGTIDNTPTTDVDLSKLFISETGTANQIALTGATITAGNGATITITLTGAQRTSVVALNTPQLDISANAVKDTSGNLILAAADNPITITTTPPNKPSNLIVVGAPTENSITLSWGKNSTTNILGYKIYRAPLTAFGSGCNGQDTYGGYTLQSYNTTNITGNTVTYRQTGLLSGNNFKFSVISINGTGSSTNSTVTAATNAASGTTNFIANHNFESGQSFSSGSQFTSGQSFTGTQTFGTGTKFGSGTTFTGTQNLGGSSLKFGSATAFCTAQTFGNLANFTGAQSFTGVNTFGSDTVFGAAQTFGTPNQIFGSGTTFGKNTSFTGAQDFADASLKFDSGTTFSSPQTFGTGSNFTGAQSFTGYNTFGSNAKFGAGQTFGTVQNFAALANFTAPTTFTTNQFFGAGTAFAKNQQFASGSTFKFTNSSLSFGSGTSFGAARAFGSMANFTGAQSFAANTVNAFGTATEFGAAQIFPNAAQSFGTNISFGKNTNFGTVLQTFKQGAKFDTGSTFVSGQSMPANTVLATGFVLERISCDTTCTNATAAKILSPGEKLSPGVNPAAIGSSISTTDKSISIPGLGFEMTFSTVDTAGTVSVDLMDPSLVSAATAASDGSLTMTASNGNQLHSLTSITDISVNATSGAATSGSMTITLPYDDTALGGIAESDLKMIHYTGGVWVEENSCTTDTTNNKITCTVTSLSPVGIGSSSSSSSSSSSGGGGDNTPPSTYIKFSTMDFPLTIDDIGFKLPEFSNTIPTQDLEINKIHQFTVLLYENSGADALQHVVLFMNLKERQDQVRYSDTFVSWDKSGGIEINDPHDFIHSSDAQLIKNKNMAEVKFNIQFKEEMGKSNLIIRSWDETRNSGDTIVYDAINVIQSSNADVQEQDHTKSDLPFKEKPIIVPTESALPKEKTLEEKRAESIILQEKQSKIDRLNAQELHQKRLEHEQEIIAMALEQSRTDLEKARKNSEETIQQMKDTLTKQAQEYTQHQTEFIKQTTERFQKQIIEKTNNEKTNLDESRQDISLEAKQITHEKNIEYASSEDAFKKKPMPTESQITDMEKNTDALSYFDKESIEKIHASKDQIKQRLANDLKQADHDYQKRKYEDKITLEQKIRSTTEYLYGILDKTALNEFNHLKTIETKRK